MLIPSLPRNVRSLAALLLLPLLACSEGEQRAPQPIMDNAPASSHPTVNPHGAMNRTGAAGEMSDGTTETNLGPFSVTVPEGWQIVPPSSNMRKAQYALPRAEGDDEDGELVVYYFGQGEGGSVNANIDRWIGQFGQPDGSSSADKTKRSTRTVSGHKVTIVDITGIYQAPVMPMNPNRKHNKPGFRMLAAIVETGAGPYFFKLVGPQETIDRWKDAFDAYVNSIKAA